ncbi:MAG: hypothetical protein NHB14_20955 [Desulfosporosinus sp.]|nr:hypothetical protein [Desulfosporosinus sp.]
MLEHQTDSTGINFKDSIPHQESSLSIEMGAAEKRNPVGLDSFTGSIRAFRQRIQEILKALNTKKGEQAYGYRNFGHTG